MLKLFRRLHLVPTQRELNKAISVLNDKEQLEYFTNLIG